MALVLNGSGITSANIADGTITTDDILASDVKNLKSGRKNLIINGDMRVSQRGTSYTGNQGALRTVDRIRYTRSGIAPSLTHTQSTDAPDGFSNSWKLNVDTGQAVDNIADYSVIDYIIEAQDLQHLDYGKSNAKSVTLTFWVKSNVLGTYAVSINQVSGGRNISSTYTIDASGVWEEKTVTFIGDISGVINNDSTGGLNIEWFMSAGTNYTSGSNGAWSATIADRGANHAVEVLATTGNYFQITGVQLEVGSVATDFEHRSYGEELALCQRYYFKSVPATSSPSQGRYMYRNYEHIWLAVRMRGTPTFTSSSSFVPNRIFQDGWTNDSSPTGGDMFVCELDAEL